MGKRSFGKKAQQIMGMSFGVIFSLLLIALFIVIAFIAVNHFLDLGRCGEVGLFYDNFQKKITEAWSMQYEESSFKINLPSGIEKVCFANLSGNILNQADYEKIKNYDVYDANLFLIPIEKTCDMPYKLIKHINITKITKSENPYCIENSKEMKIKKGFYDKLVFVERNV